MKTTPRHRFWRSNDLIISIKVYIRWDISYLSSITLN